MNFKYFPINIARTLIFLLVPIVCYISGYRQVISVGILLVVLSFIYAIAEAVFDLTKRFKLSPYVATFFDITGGMFYCYLAGMDSFFFGVYIYIVSICALNTKTKQAEFAVIYTIGLHLSVILLIFAKIIPYVNVIYGVKQYSTYSLISAFVVGNGVVYFCYYIMRKIVKKNDTLLRSLLPEKVISIIDEKSFYAPRKFENATVVFTDFCNFTNTTNNIDPHLIVESLERYFLGFDEILKKYNITRLKTIGDGYMFVSGIPEEIKNSIHNACNASLEILEFVHNAKNYNPNLLSFDVRIGIASGPVVAAVLGKDRISFDIWSPVVNLASRLESNAEQCSIYICSEVHHNVKNEFETNYIGKKELKGIGIMDIYQLLATAHSIG